MLTLARALRLAGDGCMVVARYSGNKERADEVVANILASGGTALAMKANVADETDMKLLFDAVTIEFGGLDVLVHTAGIMPLAPSLTWTLEHLITCSGPM
jgi:3-oxoacyl-[acyl-carrier protein] reductase